MSSTTNIDGNILENITYDLHPILEHYRQHLTPDYVSGIDSPQASSITHNNISSAEFEEYSPPSSPHCSF